MADELKELSQEVNKILKNYQHDQGMLVAILQDIQAKYKYLSKEALKQVSQGLNIPQSQVYSVATFFKVFSLQPRGRHLINVCLGTACHVRGAGRVMDRMEMELGIKSGETTQDRKYTLESVNCVGACALGPIVVIDGEYSGEMTADKVKPLLKRYD